MIVFDWQVKEVRTLDDTMITVKLMIFYELKDVIKMVCFIDTCKKKILFSSINVIINGYFECSMNKKKLIIKNMMLRFSSFYWLWRPFV